MGLFDFLKSKQKDAEAPIEVEGQFSSEALLEWPSLPEEGNKVPSLEDIIDHSGQNAKYAKAVIAKCEKEKRQDDLLEYQVVMQSQYGLFTIPAMIRRDKSGEFLAFYSYTDDWDDEAIQRLLNWVICIRGCDFIHTFKIVLCDSLKDVPRRVNEIISKRTVDRMMISMVPHLRKSEPRVNARIFAEAYGFYYNDKKILNYDLTSLEEVERWYKDVVRSCAKNSFYYPFYVHFLSAFFGQVLCESFKVKWQFYSGTNIVVIPPAKLKPRKHGMMPGEMKVNILQICSDFACNPRPESSLVVNFNMVKAEILKEA